MGICRGQPAPPVEGSPRGLPGAGGFAKMAMARKGSEKVRWRAVMKARTRGSWGPHTGPSNPSRG